MKEGFPALLGSGNPEAHDYLAGLPEEIDRSDAADAARFRWLLEGNGYFMEENFLCGHEPDAEEKDRARREIDTVMRGE